MPPRQRVTVEACIDSLESALSAERGGADRIELCADLDQGGTTPEQNLLARVIAAVSIPVFPIVRPRAGDFVYSVDEIDAMLRAIDQARSAGATGVVIGALGRGGAIDVPVIERLRHRASGMSVTFHKAFDLTPDPIAALETLIELGVDRVLTSGQRGTAWEGRDLLRALVQQAGDRIEAMAGGTVRPENARPLIDYTGVRAVHARLSDEGSVGRLVHEVGR